MSENQDIKITREEKALLVQHLDFYLDLESGRLKPITKEQGHFIAVIEGHFAAET